MWRNCTSRWRRKRACALTLGRRQRPVAIEGNRSLIAQALANLVDNAIKYTPAGGKVRIRAAIRLPPASNFASPTAVPAFRWRSARAWWNVSCAWKPAAIRPARAWACRWWRRWRISTMRELMLEDNAPRPEGDLAFPAAALRAVPGTPMKTRLSRSGFASAAVDAYTRPNAGICAHRPMPFDPARAARVQAALAERGLCQRGQPLLGRGVRQQPLSGPAGAARAGALAAVFRCRTATVVNAAIAAGSGRPRMPPSEAQAMAELRTAKRRAALAIAMADIAGTWELEQVTARADPIRRCLRAGRACVFCCAQAAHSAMADRTARAGSGFRPHRAGDGQVRRPRTQLFQRHRSGRVLRRRAISLRKRGDPRGAAVDIVRGLVKLLLGDHRRRLCLPRRSAAPARRRRHSGRDLDRCGARTITRPWARTGSAPP